MTDSFEQRCNRGRSLCIARPAVEQLEQSVVAFEETQQTLRFRCSIILQGSRVKETRIETLRTIAYLECPNAVWNEAHTEPDYNFDKVYGGNDRYRAATVNAITDNIGRQCDGILAMAMHSVLKGKSEEAIALLESLQCLMVQNFEPRVREVEIEWLRTHFSWPRFRTKNGTYITMENMYNGALCVHPTNILKWAEVFVTVQGKKLEEPSVMPYPEGMRNYWGIFETLGIHALEERTDTSRKAP